MSSNQLVLLNSLIAQQNFSSLQAKVQTLTAEGSTRLYGTSFDTLKSWLFPNYGGTHHLTTQHPNTSSIIFKVTKA
ncbi:hypothetical protein, partial [Legionella pneumophila]